MPTAAFATLGCKVNQYETQRILDDFEARGFGITDFACPADVYVINTCSVTQAAERKSRHLVRRIARSNPNAVVVMTGCYGEMARIKGEKVEEAALTVPNTDKLQTLQHVLRAHPHLEEALRNAVPPAVSPPRRCRAMIKAQDGCNVFCSFCSIPFTRHVMQSRTMAEIIQESAWRAEQGCKEIVVTGVLVGAYGMEEGFLARNGHPADLADLLLALARTPGIERVRLSSIEPTQVSDKLLAAFRSELRLCRHLHIPLQSGDNDVLRAMNRPYNREFYLQRCAEAKRQVADLAITSDIMVGFPGETRQAFENTIGVVREIGFARAHLFRYSPRPNTPAAEMKHQVPDEEKEARSKELAGACSLAQSRFIAGYIGRRLDVLVEGRDRGAPLPEPETSGNALHTPINPAASSGSSLLAGYTSNYIRVRFTGSAGLIGSLLSVQLLEQSGDGAIGESSGASMEAPPDALFLPNAQLAGRL